MKHKGLEPKTHTAPNPGLYCPSCHSSNTAWVKPWVCLDCLEEFKREEAAPPNPTFLFPIAVTKEGDHWYKKRDGVVFCLTKQEMKEGERIYVNPELSSGFSNYDPVWSYYWIRKEREIEFLRNLEKLSPAELESLARELNS